MMEQNLFRLHSEWIQNPFLICNIIIWFVDAYCIPIIYIVWLSCFSPAALSEPVVKFVALAEGLKNKSQKVSTILLDTIIFIQIQG